MNKRVLIADCMSRWPPLPDVRVFRLGGKNRSVASYMAGIFVGIKLKPIEILQIPSKRPLASENLKLIGIALTGCEAGCLEGTQRAAIEVYQHLRRVIHIDGIRCATTWFDGEQGNRVIR